MTKLDALFGDKVKETETQTETRHIQPEVLREICDICRKIQEESTKSQPVSHLFSKLHDCLQSINNHPNRAAIQKVAEACKPENLHYPNEESVKKAEAAVVELEEAEETELAEHLKQAVEALKAPEQPPKTKERNPAKAFINLTKKLDDQTRAKMKGHSQEIQKIKERIGALTTASDGIFAMKTANSDSKTFDLGEISEEWGRVKQVLEGISKDAPPHIQQQADDLRKIMEGHDFTKPLSREDFSKFQSSVDALKRASQEEIPTITQAISTLLELYRLALKACERGVKHQERFGDRMAANQRV